MSEQIPTVIEEDYSWKLLSDGRVITLGHPLWEKCGGRQPRPLNATQSGPRKILRREFDEMSQQERAKVIAEGSQIVDSLEVKTAPPPPPPQGPEIKRSRFEEMSQSERSRVISEGARIVD